MRTAIVVGGGLGGLAAAARLASAGLKVTVLEQQPQLGGKLQRIEQAGYRFDRGPSTITMPEAFEHVFRSVGRRMEDYLSFYRLKEGARNCFADGTIVDFHADPAAMEQQIAQYSAHDARNYRKFLAVSANLYRHAQEQFMNRLLLSWKDKATPRMAAAFLRIRPLSTMNGLLGKYFRHPNTLAMFGRFATYVGSAPAQSPAIFAMLPYLEISLGVYGVKGGTYRIAEALRELGEQFGVRYMTSVRVSRICTRNGQVTGVETDAGDFAADLVIANGDLLTTCRDLLDAADRPSMPDHKIAAYEPSLSGYSILAGIRKQYKLLKHHTVFFPAEYGSEFRAIFSELDPPNDPAIYICNASYSEPGLAPEGASNLFILANAPCTSADRSRTGHSLSGQSRVDHLRARNSWADQSWVDQWRVNQSRVNQSRVNQSRVNQSWVDHPRSDRSRTDHPWTDRSWADRSEAYRAHLLDKLDERGIGGLQAAEVLMDYTPDQLEQHTSAYRGAIYGISSNSARQTFMRPGNRGDVRGLWFVGGTTHPGGGTPLVVNSGRLVAEAILAETAGKL